MKLASWFTYLALTQPRTAAVLELFVVVGTLYGLAWIASVLLSRAPPAVRHAVWAAAVVGSLILPIVHLKQILGGGLAAGASWVPAPGEGAPTTGAVLACLWSGGALFLLGRSVLGWWLVSRVVGAARPLHPVPAVGGSADAPKRCTYVVSNETRTPFAVGIIRPRVVLPDGLPPGSDQWTSVLLHEWAHIRRFDVLTLYLGLFARALFWPVPFVWIALRRLRAEAEAACDAAVVAAGVNRADYARQLARFSEASPATVLAGAPALGSQLFRRIQSLCGPNPPRQATSRSLVWTLVCSALVLSGVARLELPTADLGFVGEEGTAVWIGNPTGP